jgi:Flp pilus assembly protein TadB
MFYSQYNGYLCYIYDKNFFKRLVFIIQIIIVSLYALAAIQALKRKKRYEKQLQQIDGTLSTIEMQREALEGANTNTAVLQTMKNSADALKAAHQHM